MRAPCVEKVVLAVGKGICAQANNFSVIRRLVVLIAPMELVAYGAGSVVSMAPEQPIGKALEQVTITLPGKQLLRRWES